MARRPAFPDRGSLPPKMSPRDAPATPRLRRIRARQKIPWDQRQRWFISVPSVIPRFEEPVRRSGVHFGITSGWTYGDGARSRQPHFVLFNHDGYSHFVLPFRISDSNIVVRNIQREYSTMGTLIDHKRFWNREFLPGERAVAQELRKQLGTHPSEVLFSQFLYRFRNGLKSGKLKLYWDKSHIEEYDKLQMYLIERFFKPTPNAAGYYELSLDKRRVREALGLPPLKKK